MEKKMFTICLLVLFVGFSVFASGIDVDIAEKGHLTAPHSRWVGGDLNETNIKTGKIDLENFMNRYSVFNERNFSIKDTLNGNTLLVGKGNTVSKDSPVTIGSHNPMSFKSDLNVPPSPANVPENSYVYAPRDREVTYSNENAQGLNEISWTFAEAKAYADPPGHLWGVLFFIHDWAAFDISVDPVPVDKELVKCLEVTTYDLAENAGYTGDEITIAGVTYVRIADVTGDAKKENINENRVVTAAVVKSKALKPAVFVYEVFTNAANRGISSTGGGGTNMIGTGPVSANFVSGSASKGLTREVGVSGITGTLYGQVVSTK
jgi:hypothetical protein